MCVLQSKEAVEQQAASARAEAEAAQSEVTELQSAAQGAQSAQGAEAAVHRLVELMYFATVSLRPTLQLRAPVGLTSIVNPLRPLHIALNGPGTIVTSAKSLERGNVVLCFWYSSLG